MYVYTYLKHKNLEKKECKLTLGLVSSLEVTELGREHKEALFFLTFYFLR